MICSNILSNILFHLLLLQILRSSSNTTTESFSVVVANNIIPQHLTTPLSATSASNFECPSTTTSSTTTTPTAATTNTDNSMTTSTKKATAVTALRTVQKILPRPSAHWVGDGFPVYPVFDSLAFTNDISPLLMFDYAEPRHFPPHPVTTSGGAPKPLGVGQHPHRGFETVSIAFQGEVEHHDNTGNTGVIRAGDVQWMTAGRGIVHEEYHSKEFTKNGGTFEMCQLWVNLPKQHKMTKPKYQAITNAQIPIVNLPLDSSEDDAVGTARIIAGELGTTHGAATTFSPIQVWDINLPTKDSIVDVPYPSHHRGMVFVRRGSVEILDDDTGTNGKVLQPQEVGMLRQPDMDGEAGTDTSMIRIRVLENNTSVLLLGGEPLDEPIAAQGPFVMNTHQEIQQAMTDYRAGKF